jgi:hypothetical protein
LLQHTINIKLLSYKTRCWSLICTGKRPSMTHAGLYVIPMSSQKDSSCPEIFYHIQSSEMHTNKMLEFYWHVIKILG